MTNLVIFWQHTRLKNICDAQMCCKLQHTNRKIQTLLLVKVNVRFLTFLNVLTKDLYKTI